MYDGRREKLKELIRTLKQLYLVSWRNALSYSVCSLLGGVVGIIITLVILAVDGTGEDYGQIGAFFSMAVGMMLLFFAGMFQVSNEFNLAISMGKTRKYFVPAQYLLLAMNMAIVLVISLVIGLLEDALYSTIYPDAVCEFAITGGLMHPDVFLCAVFGGAMLILLWGALILKYTAKIFWIIWILCMIFSMASSKIGSAVHETQDSALAKMIRGIIEFFVTISSWQIVIGIFCVTVAGVVAAFALMRRQRVTA